MQLNDEISSCQSINDAYRICFEKSGVDLKEVAWQCGWRDSGKELQQILYHAAAMPHDCIISFMAACGNALPLHYLDAKTRNQDSDSVDTVTHIIHEIKEELRPRSESIDEGTTLFSLSGSSRPPNWLIEEVRALYLWKD